MAREKKTVIVNVSREKAEEAMGEFAVASNGLQKIEAEMNAQIASIREKYQDKINDLNEAKDQSFEILEVYAEEQHESWGKRKSLEMNHGTIGYRLGTPKVKFDKGFNSKSSTAILQDKFPQYVRSVVELNKEALIGDRESEGFDKVAKAAHLQVVQEETFFVESKSEVLQEA